MKLNYQSIKELLNGEVAGLAVDENGEHIVLQWERIQDCRKDMPSYDGPLEEPEDVYTATWVSKRTENRIWYVTHTYHADGMVEETFDCEAVEGAA